MSCKRLECECSIGGWIFLGVAVQSLYLAG